METMESTQTRLYVDVGQTGSRIQDSRGHRNSIDVGFTPGTGVETVVRDVLSRIENPHADTVLLSLTGLRGKVPELGALGALSSDITGCTDLGVCDDGLAWSVGALDGRDGVSLAVGGGVVAVARSGNSFVHMDGNGSDFGDSGGAFWVGRKGIRAAIRSIEGSDEPTSLAEAFISRFGPHDDFVRECVSKEDVHRASIEFSTAVLDAAVAGDQVAVSIVTSGAKRLGALVVSAADQAGLLDSTVVATVTLGGGLMKHPLYRALVEEHIHSGAGTLSVIEPHGDALDGLVHLDNAGRNNIVSLMGWWRA